MYVHVEGHTYAMGNHVSVERHYVMSNEVKMNGGLTPCVVGDRPLLEQASMQAAIEKWP
jgi:hypothetical protein